MRTLLSFIAILLLATSSLPLGFADITPIDSENIESIEEPIIKTSKIISINLDETMKLSTDAPRKKQIEDKPSVFIADYTSKSIHLDEDLSIQTKTADLKTQFDYVIVQPQPSVERIVQTDKLRDDRKKNLKIESLYLDTLYEQESEDLIPINSKILQTTFFADPFNMISELVNEQNILESINIFEEQLVSHIFSSVSNFDPSVLFDNTFVVVIFAPLVFFLFIFAEDVKFKFEKVRPFLSLIFAVIILSTAVITPYSISSVYWPEAYADTGDMDEPIYDNTTASTDNTSSSSTPAEDTETVEDSTSDNTDASVGSTSSSSTPAEDTESTEVSSSTQPTASTDNTSSSSTPAEDTETVEDSTSDNTDASVGSTSSSSTPAEDTESTEVSSSTQPTASTDNTSSSSTPAEDTETVEDSTSDNTDASVGSTSSSSTPAEDTESTEVSSTNSTTTEVIPTNSTTTEVIPTNSTTTEVIPTNSTTTEVIPTNSTTTEVIPTNSTTTEVIPTNSTTTEVIPTNSTTTEVIPTNSTTTEVIPTNSTTTEVIPTNSTTTEVIPVNGTVIPGTNSTDIIPVNGTVIPGTNSTDIIPVNGTVIPGTNSTDIIPVNGTVIPGTNSTDIIPVNGTVIPGTNSTDIIPVNGTVIPGTNSTDIIPVNGTVIPGTNSTIVIVPNATESWSFDSQVNGSRFIGDVYIEDSDSSLILDGDGYLANDGNSTSDLSNISITAWVNPDYSGGSAEFTVISKENAFALTINNNIEPQHVAIFSVFDGIKWHSVETLEKIGNDWSHIAATFNGTTLSIYTNGTHSNTNESIEKIELTIEGHLEVKTIETIESTSDVVVGASLDNNRSLDDVTKQFSGEIKEVNVFNVYLSAEQVAEIYLQTLPMIESLYNNTDIEIIEDDKEIIIIDVLAPIPITNSTNGNATSNDTIDIDSTNSTNTIITFNDTQNHIPIETELLNEELNQLTLSTWINPLYTSGSAEFTVVSKENSFVLGINNIYSPEKIPTFAIFDGITWTKISGTTQVYDWSHLVAVINGTEISLYLNGNLESTTTIPKSFAILDGEVSPVSAEIAENDSDLIIGAYLNTNRNDVTLSNHFSGLIDDVLVYKEALSQAQIYEIYSGYVTPSENNEIPFESHLLSFTDTITVFLNNELVSGTIHVAPIDPESNTPSVVQSLSFGDYVSYKVNGPVGESSIEVISFSDVVVATIISSNSTTIDDDLETIFDSLSFSDVVVATIISSNSTTIDDDLETIFDSLTFNDQILVALNQTSLINLSESLSFDSLLSLGNNTIISNGVTSEIQLEHDTIEINKPVTWKHDVSFSNNTESVAVEIPADAEIIMVKTFNDTSETIIFDSKELISNNSNYTGIYDDQDISEKDLKKYFRLIDSVQTIETNINKTNDKIAYYADLDTAKAHKKLDKLNAKLEKLEDKLENKLSKLSDTIPLASLQQVDEMIQEEKPLKVLLLNNTDANIELTFTTPAAYTVEQNNSTNDKFDKKVTVAHDSALHYTNVTAFSDIPEELVIGGTDFKLFWNIKSNIPVNSTIIQDTNSTTTEVIPTNSTTDIPVNGTLFVDSIIERVDVTDDPRFAVQFVDTDDNGIVDRMQWIVPQLSEQEFDIEADLQIINVQSYPAVGGNWKVKFTTNGTADLIISAINGTTFGTESPDDLLFLELNNGTHKLNPIVNGNTITFYNYSSTEIGFEESEVLTPFKHHLMFQFGNKTAYANNSAFVPNGPKVILLYGDPVVLGSPDTEDDMALTNPVIPGWDEVSDRQDSIFIHDNTAGGCNGIEDSCTEIQVSEAGTYRVNYGLSVDGGITASRYQAVSYLQNDTDGTGGYNEDKGTSCFDSGYRRSADNKNTVVWSSECLVELEANGKVRVGLSKVSSLTGSGSYSFADDENWFSMQQIENPVISLRATNTSIPVDSGSAEMVFNYTDIVVQDPSAFTFTQDTANWGDDTQQPTATTVNWLRCMGGTSPDRDDLELDSISISSVAGSDNARVAVYQGGSLSDPQAATLVWDGGLVSEAAGFVTASGANTPLAGNEVTWVCIKDNDNNFSVHYDTAHDAGSDYQSGVGRWQATGISNDETIAYPATLAGGGTSFSNFWYSWYLTYKTAEGSVTVDQDGLYKVSYSGLIFDDTFDSSRSSKIGKIQTNSSGSFVDDVYGGSLTYNRDENGINYSALSSSTILELNENDEIRFMMTDEGTRTTDAVDYHMDIEYLGSTSEANVLRIHDSAGGVDLDSASDVIIDWDTEDEKGDHFGFTATSSEITVNRDGLYHIAYGIDGKYTINDGDRFHTKSRLQIDTGSGFNNANACFGDSTSRGTANSNNHHTSTAASSCLLDLKIGDKLRAVSLRVGDEPVGVDVLTEGDEIYLTIQSLSISNPPLQESLSFNDVVSGIVIKNAPESLSLVDTVTTTLDAKATLTESLSLIDDPAALDLNGKVIVSLQESLSLDDGTITNLVLPIRTNESLSFTDVLDYTHDGTITLSESLSLDDGSVVAIPFVPSFPDFKTQSGTFTFTGATGTITEGTDFDACSSAESCFFMQVGTRHTSMGATSGGSTQQVDDWTVHVSDLTGLTSATDDIEFTRIGTVGEQRIAWQIVEYIGAAGGSNEMKVLDSGTVTFGTGSTTADGAVVSGGAADDNDVAVIITGVSNPDTGVVDIQTHSVTTEWIGASDLPRFTRTATGSDAVVVSYTVVEFTGANWNLQRITHEGADFPDPSTETITDVGDLSSAFVLQAQQRNADDGASEGLCEVAEMVYLSDTDELSFDHETGATNCTYSSLMNEVVWVLSNIQSDIGKKMIVEHQQPTDQVNTSGSEEENWQRTINALTYGQDETSIFGFTAVSDGEGTAWPRGSVVAELTDSTTVDFWQSDSGQEVEYSFSIVQWPRSRTISFEFTEGLSLSDSASVVFANTESLSLVDTVTTTLDAKATLTESLSLIDDPAALDLNGKVLVSLQESLSLDDGTITNLVLPIRTNESLSFTDVLDYTHDGTITLSESLSLDDGTIFREQFVESDPDFKTQSGTFTISDTNTSGTITSVGGTDFDVCTGDCFMMQVSTRHTGNGQISGGGIQNVDDVTVYISNDGGLDTAGTVTYTRSGSTNDNRIAWQILEYIGPAGGPNEMKVLDRGTVTFGTGSTTADGAVVSGGAADDNDVAVIITGVSNPDTGTSDYETGLVTTEWIGASDIPRFTRTATGSDATRVSYAVVEFTGTAWNLQRIEHTGGDAPFPIQTQSITDIDDLSRAFVLQAQQRNDDSSTADGVCEIGERVHLSDTDELSFYHEVGSTACTYDSQMEEVVWILSNTITATGKKMIVEHQQPTDQVNTSGSEEENWQRTINALTYGQDETSIFGFTANADGTDNSHPRGHIVAELTDSTTVDFWQSDAGQEVAYSFSAVQWPRSRILSVDFTEDLSFIDNINKDISITKAESLLLVDVLQTTNNFSVSFTEDLDFLDDLDRTISVSFTESLDLDDNINRNIPISFTEDLDFLDNINKANSVSFTEDLDFLDDLDRTISVSFTEDLDFLDNINKANSVSLTESLDLDDNINRNIQASFTEDLDFLDDLDRTISVSFTEDLDFLDNINKANSVSLTESLDLDDNINRNIQASFTEDLDFLDDLDRIISVSFTESLDLDDNINRVIPVSLTETLDLDDNINRNIQASFTEDLDFLDDLDRTISVSFTEDLDFLDDLDRTISVSFTEDLDFLDDLDRTISVSFTEDLDFLDNINKANSVSLTESLDLDDNINRNIQASFTEDLDFLDDLDRTISVSFTESLDLDDNINRIIPVSLTETLDLDDNINRNVPISLTESLDLDDNINRIIPVSFTESLDLDDNINRVIPVSFTESLDLDDNINRVIPVSFTETLDLDDNINRNVPISLTESLDLDDNINRNVPISLTESLDLDDNINRIIPVSLTESLDLDDNINRNVPISLTESLDLDDNINRNVPVSLTESLDLDDNINRIIPVSFTETLDLDDNINRNVPVSLTESLDLDDNINRIIPVSLTETLDLDDNINRNVPISLTESLDLDDNINRNVPISLTESLDLDDNINRIIPVSLTESLDLDDNINRNVPISLTESLDLDDNINRNVPVSLTESLDLDDNINRNVPISLTESLDLDDNINRIIPVSLTESLDLDDNINRIIPVSLTESLDLDDNINRIIPVSLTESLDLDDNINRIIPVSLTESLDLDDNINRVIPVSLTETLDLDDNINRVIPVSLTESLDLDDNINRIIPVSFTETLDLDDNINRNVPISLTESLDLDDNINRIIPISLTESLDLDDNINRNVPISLTESLDLDDNINRVIPVSFTESLDLDDNINRNVPVSLTESLDLDDNINRIIPISLTESLDLDDNINRNVPISLTESLDLDDNINRIIPVSLTESLDLDDNINRNVPVSLTESLDLDDNINRNVPISLTESLDLDDNINRIIPVSFTESLDLDDNINRNIQALFTEDLALNDGTVQSSGSINVFFTESLDLDDNINRVIPVSLTESLDLDDNINRIIPISLTETLDLDDNINRNVPVSLTESLDLDDNINRVIPISLTESLDLDDNINRIIPISLTETLDLDDNINRNVPVSLTETLDLDDNINRNVPVSLTESLDLDDNINRVIPVSLTESLDLDDNINRVIPVSFTESLDLDDNINRIIPVSLTESLDLDDNINRIIPVSLTESLDLDDNINRIIPVSFTESLDLDDNINRIIPISLTETLDLDDNINRVIPVSLTETLDLDDNINRVIPVSLTETLDLDDNINRVIPVSLTESLDLDDNINRVIPISLTESLDLDDNINRNVPVSLTESLDLDDNINRVIPVSLTESLDLDDNINRVIPVSFTESLDLDDNINRVIPVSLTESLDLDDNINRIIPVSFTESLDLDDNINRIIPVSFTESLDLDDNINRNVPVSLTESLDLDDNINRNVPISLTESLDLDDNINRNVPISLTESLDLDDNINRIIPVSFTESLDLDDNINRVIPVSFTESLDLDDNINRNVPISLTESLDLDDNINRVIPVSFTESLDLDDNINRVIPVSFTEDLALNDGTVQSIALIIVSLTESLDLDDNINRIIPISFTETLDLDDNINRVIPVSLTESLDLDDNINRVIPVSLTESLDLDDNINRVIPVSLTESLDLDDNINRIIPVSFTESLDLDDNINRNVPISFTETLDLDDNINRIIPVSFTEDLDFLDDLDRTISVSFTESLDLDDNINRVIPVSLTESLDLDDNINRNIPVSLTESLDLDDNINRVIPVSLTESLDLDDNINRNIPVSLTESLDLDDNINRNVPVSLTESLDLDDNINRNIPVSLTESLDLDDNINRIIPIMLTENLDFLDEIDRNIALTFTESLTLDDVLEITHAATVSLDESLELNDIMNKMVPASITESLTLKDSETSLKNLGPNQVLVEEAESKIKITKAKQQLVVLSSNAQLDSIEICANDNSGLENTVMNYTALLAGTSVTITNGWTTEACIDDSNTTFDVEVKIADSTTVTGPAGWNGIFELQTLSSVSLSAIVTETETGTTTETFDEITAVELGIGAQDLTFDEPVRLEFIGDGGKGHKTFFKKSSDSSITFITTTCNADDLATVKAQLGGTGECSIESGSDLIIWTTHATTFGDARSRSSTSSSSSGESSGSSSGGGITGVSSAGAGAGGFGGILGTPLTINEISYDKCSENMARIIISSDADVPPTVKVATAKSGVVFATLAEIQPYEELNKFSTVDRYLYELPISSDESFMMVSVTEKVGNTSHTVQASVKLLACEGTTVVVPLPDDITPEAETAARIFDTKIQIGNGTTYDAESESEFLFISGQDLKVSAIIDSETPLQRVELRSITMGQTDSEYIGIKMDISSLYVSNSTYVVSGTIPSFFMVEPGMTYWLHITDEDGAQTASTHYNIGVKPTTTSDIEIEVDMPTIRPSGSIVQPEFYLFNEEEPSYGIVSLMVDGEVVSKKSQLFGIGQTQIIFNWNIPTSDGFVSYDIQGVVELYDSKITTVPAALATHPKTITVSASEMPSLEVIQSDGQILADPALVYASNTDSNVRFTVTDPQGQCIIGGADECLVNDSTRGKRGGLESIPYGDQILRVRYSGADNALERFSITSIDPIMGQWTVSLESEDAFGQQAHASEDVNVKIKYRYHSETITAFS